MCYGYIQTSLAVQKYDSFFIHQQIWNETNESFTIMHFQPREKAIWNRTQSLVGKINICPNSKTREGNPEDFL